MKKIILGLLLCVGVALAQDVVIAPLKEKQISDVVRFIHSGKYANLSTLQYGKDFRNNTILISDMDSYYLYQLSNNTYALVFQSGASGGYSNIVDVLEVNKKKVSFLGINSVIQRDFKLSSPATSCMNWYCSLGSTPFVRSGDKIIVNYLGASYKDVCKFELESSVHLVQLNHSSECKI